MLYHRGNLGQPALFPPDREHLHAHDAFIIVHAELLPGLERSHGHLLGFIELATLDHGRYRHSLVVVFVERFADFLAERPERIEITLPAFDITERREIVSAKSQQLHLQVPFLDALGNAQHLADQLHSLVDA